MAGNDARYKDWVDDWRYLYSCGGQPIWTVHSMSDLKFTLYIMLEKQRRREMLVGIKTESHDVLIGKGKLSVAHHVAGQT